MHMVYKNGDRAMRVNPEIWQKVRDAAIQNNAHMKEIMNLIFNGTLDPVDMKPKGN